MSQLQPLGIVECSTREPLHGVTTFQLPPSWRFSIGAVLALFLLTPYSRMAHGAYRFAASATLNSSGSDAEASIGATEETTMRIAFLGFGEAGRAFCDTLRTREDAPKISAYDLRDDAEMRDAMERRGVRAGTSSADALAEVDWIISAVTADQSLQAARGAAPSMVQGQTFLDINSVSPARKRQTAQVIEEAGGAYVDIAVMAPVHPRGHATATLVAGPTADRLAPELAALGFAFEVVGHDAGAATAIKMVRSLFVKGLEAITVEAMLAASASGCFDRVLDSLSSSFPGLGWPDNATYTFERTLRHGLRRAAEMRESAATLNELGLTGDLAWQIAEVQHKMGALEATDLPERGLADAVAEIARQRRATS